MSLIHWWPLNGDLKDYGINNANPTLHGTVSYLDTGKIGKTVKFNGSLYFDTSIQATNTMSFAFWVYPDSASAWTDMFSIGTNLGRIEITSTTNYTYNWYQTSNGGTNLCNSGYIFTLGNQQWYHIVMTVDGTNVKFYVNGELKATTAQTGQLTSAMDDNLITWGRRGVSSSSIYYARYNDIRIYDHALSAKEVKEISKVLCLHYTFEDPYAEGTTNLITSISAGGQTTVNNGVVTTSGVNADTYFTLNLSESLTNGVIYTISCMAENMGGKTFTFPIGGQANTALSFTIHEGYNSYTFTMNSFNAGTNRCFMDDTARYAYANKCIFYNWQIEKKDHATPYVNGTRATGKIFDCSGYGHDAEIIYNPPYVLDTGSGKYCVDLTNNTTKGYYDLGSGALNFLTNGTVCFWAKYTDTSYKMLFGSNDAGSRYYLANTPNGSSSGGAWYSNVSNQGTAYCDGEVYNKPKCDSQWHFYAFTGVNLSNWGDYKYFLCKYANNESNSFQFHGYLADLKIYATALSASDILAEYNRKASIDKSGILFTGEFEEGNSTNINVTKTAMVKCNNIVEGTSNVKFLSGYTQLEYLDEVNPAAGQTSQHNRCAIDSVQYNYIEAGLNVSGSGSSGGIMLAGKNGSWWKSWQGDGSSTVVMNPLSLSQNTWYDVKYTCNSVFTGLWTAGWTDSTNYWTPQSLKISYIKTYNGSVLTGHFIPVKRNSDNVLGLYDLVNRQFYTNTGSGTFTAGPEIGKISAIYANEIKEI